MLRLVIILFVLFSGTGFAQINFLNGRVIDSLTNEPIQYAKVWYQDSIYNGASTDSLGEFALEITNNDVFLITSFMGYIIDTVKIFKDIDREVLIKLIPLSASPPKYFYIIAGDTILYNNYDWNNGIQCPGTVPKGCKTYCNGQPCEGEIITYYVSGQIYKIANYKNGELIEGPYKCYYENGQLDQIGEYLDGHRIGQWLFYSEHGILGAIMNYDSIGRLVTEYWFFSNGNLEGYTHIDWDSACFKSMITYYESGKLREQYFEPICEKDSAIWIEYYQDGTIKSEKQYKSNIEHGIFKYYDVSGKLIRTEEYEMGKLINTSTKKH
ncbi:MAG: carboxypeptidase-like regulatory domain-containing protein [Bacteroidales bacterium]|nr:carboxypeptidase-like regulatory domain-containing protein [Bacteroidales bacterium]